MGKGGLGKGGLGKGGLGKGKSKRGKGGRGTRCHGGEDLKRRRQGNGVGERSGEERGSGGTGVKHQGCCKVDSGEAGVTAGGLLPREGAGGGWGGVGAHHILVQKNCSACSQKLAHDHTPRHVTGKQTAST